MAGGPPRIVAHKIPSKGSQPYICVEGPDACLWFCESGASKIGSFNPATQTFREFDLPSPGSMPIGMTLGGDGHL